MDELVKYFEYPYKEGYSRFFDNDECLYIPREKLKQLLLEDLQAVKIKNIPR